MEHILAGGRRNAGSVNGLSRRGPFSLSERCRVGQAFLVNVTPAGPVKPVLPVSVARPGAVPERP